MKPAELDDWDRSVHGAHGRVPGQIDLDRIEVYEERRSINVDFITVCVVCVLIGIALAFWLMEEF